MTEDNELIEIRPITFASREFPDDAVVTCAMGWVNSERADHGFPPCGWHELTLQAQAMYYRRASAALTAYRNHEVEL